MRWQEEVFGPLLARTVENAQIQHLAEHYDLARDSRLAQAIVRYVNEVLDAEEKRRQVKRVRPGELLLKTHRGPLTVAVRTSEDIARVVNGERLDKVRRDIIERAKDNTANSFPRPLQRQWSVSFAASGLGTPRAARSQAPFGVRAKSGRGVLFPMMVIPWWNWTSNGVADGWSAGSPVPGTFLQPTRNLPTI